MKKIKHGCIHCFKVFLKKKDADACRKSHDIMYVPIIKEDLNLLAHYIMSGDRSLISDRLSKTILRYFRKG